MNEKRGCLGLVLGIALAVSLFGNLMLIVILLVSAAGNSVTEDKVGPVTFNERVLDDSLNGDSKIAVIHLRGVISSFDEGDSGEPMVDELKYALQKATDDDDVKAIILNIDSPGGEVTASDILFEAVKKVRAKKPVVVYMNAIAASGGYYIACGGSHLIASPTTLTGSIGVIIQTLNYRELFGKIGMESVIFKSGKFKDMLNGAREMTDDEKAYVQNLVMQSYGRFVGIVAKERKLEETGLRDGVADGRIMSGSDALEAKLIDELGYIEDAYTSARKLGNAPNAKIVEYQASFGLGKLFDVFGKSQKTERIEVNLTSSSEPKLQPGRWYYLPSFFVP